MSNPQKNDAAKVVIHLDGTCASLSGALLIADVNVLGTREQEIFSDHISSLDISRLTQIDTAGAWFLVSQQQHAQNLGRTLTIDGASDAQLQLIKTIRQNITHPEEAAPKRQTLSDQLEDFGRTVAGGAKKAAALISFLGQIIATMAGIMIRPRRLRLTSLVHHCHETGLNAVPIVALMAFLIGVVLAFQGSAQLRQFGAEVFVVDLIAISILRELGILLTAIIVAGRSGSAFTAAIGSMKMREEIDAMRTLGLDPVTILVVPRVLALMLMLPALGFIANIAGLLGGAVMSWIELGVSPAVFQSRLVSNTDVWHFVVGMIKAPFFALIIGVIGCYEGMLVGGNAESLGRRTSTSVVLAIFMVIVVDAMFSIFFAIVGV